MSRISALLPGREQPDPQAGPSLPLQAAPGLAEEVIAWQRVHGRHGLPWQGTQDPYRVWLSEVMLQQTQVSTVLDYFPRFLARFPDVAALAAAPLDDVLALWSGLGYYSRARHMHRCAQAVVAQHGGRFPGSAAALEQLPGIGRSTAAAIAAFCFGERAAILDGNVKRVLTRVLGFGADLAVPAEEKRLWALAQTLLPAHDVGPYTQGLMDLGATVCARQRPACTRCPLALRCVARVQDAVHLYPLKTRRLKRSQRENALLWLHHRGLMWLVQRPPSGVWASLWSLPEHGGIAALNALTAAWPGSGHWLSSVEHALTHFDWTLHPLAWHWPDDVALSAPALEHAGAGLPGRWVSPSQALSMGLPAPVRKLLLA